MVGLTLMALTNAIALRSIIYLVITQMVNPNSNVAAAIDEHTCPVPAREVTANVTAQIQLVKSESDKEHGHFSLWSRQIGRVMSL